MNGEAFSMPPTRPEVPRRRATEAVETIGWAFTLGRAGEWPALSEPSPDTVRMPEAPRVDAASRDRDRPASAWDDSTLVSFPFYVTASRTSPPPSSAEPETVREPDSSASTTQGSGIVLPPRSSESGVPMRYAVLAFVLGIALTCGAPLIGKVASKYSAPLVEHVLDARRTVIAPRAPEAAPEVHVPRAAKTEGARGDTTVRGNAPSPDRTLPKRKRVAAAPTVATPAMLEAGIGR